MKYVLSVDQSTQGTKAMIFDCHGRMLGRSDLPHRQIVNDRGWVSHDLEEIYSNTLRVTRMVVEKTGVDKNDIACLGISNQRETAAAWDRETGKPLCDAIVWQCARATAIAEEIETAGLAETVRLKTGMRLSPYFSASKWAWIFRNIEGEAEKAKLGRVALGTIDSWLIYNLTGGKSHRTDYSNASRTQLFNITELLWDQDLMKIFGIEPSCLPELTDSDGCFGFTDLGGYLDNEIPIRSALGDSHGALFGQGCLAPGQLKATYGTGSSIMMNIGDKPILTDLGVVTSLAWKIGGKVNYVLEGNINYTGAVITWMKDQVKLIDNPGETEALALAANPADHTCLVPAFSGLGAPYWDSRAEAAIIGMTRTTGRNEIVRAALDCIAWQITDIVKAMASGSGTAVSELRVDGGPTRNAYLMQFQSDVLNIPVRIPEAEELSGIGAAYAAGIAVGFLDESVFDRAGRREYRPTMAGELRQSRYQAWLDAVAMIRGPKPAQE